MHRRRNLDETWINIPTCWIILTMTSAKYWHSYHGSVSSFNSPYVVTSPLVTWWCLMAWRKLDPHLDGLVQKRCNSSALAMELHLSCNNPSIWSGTALQLNQCWIIVNWTPQTWISMTFELNFDNCHFKNALGNVVCHFVVASVYTP